VEQAEHELDKAGVRDGQVETGMQTHLQIKPSVGISALMMDASQESIDAGARQAERESFATRRGAEGGVLGLRSRS